MNSNKLITAPIVTYDEYSEQKVLILHNYVNMKGKLVVNQDEAQLLLLELYKFMKL
jgi:hypothetical protein